MVETGITITHFPTAHDYAVALTEYFYAQNLPFKSLTIRDGERILREEIKKRGKLEADDNTGLLSDPYETDYNSLFAQAKAWVKLKHPNLK